MPFSGQELTEAVRADNLLPWILNLAGARIGGHFSINTQECIHTVTHTQWTGSPPLQMHLQDRCCNCCIVTGAHWDWSIERYEVSLSLEFKCKRVVSESFLHFLLLMSLISPSAAEPHRMSGVLRVSLLFDGWVKRVELSSAALPWSEKPLQIKALLPFCWSGEGHLDFDLFVAFYSCRGRKCLERLRRFLNSAAKVGFCKWWWKAENTSSRVSISTLVTCSL